jgi:SAM-dependent methyltransferase
MRRAKSVKVKRASMDAFPIRFKLTFMILRKFINWNIRLSQAFDRLLPPEYTVDGNSDFKKSFTPQWLKPGMRVVDIGGGKNPFIALEQKQALSMHVTGVDISAQELARAPAGGYDAVICGDIAKTTGHGDADLCICQAVLEHVQDVESAFVSIASFLKPGGVALIFVPSRNALFAQLNLLLPEPVKRWVLFTAFPGSRRDQGFPSYYNNCTPARFRALAQAAGMEVASARHYYVSSYFSVLAPVYVLWRAWILLFRSMAGEQAAETFSVALKKFP